MKHFPGERYGGPEVRPEEQPDEGLPPFLGLVAELIDSHDTLSNQQAADLATFDPKKPSTDEAFLDRVLLQQRQLEQQRGTTKTDFAAEKKQLVGFAERHAQHLLELRKRSRELLAKVPEPNTIPTDPFTAKEFYLSQPVGLLLAPLSRQAAELNALGQQELYPILEVLCERFPELAPKLKMDFNTLDLRGDSAALTKARYERVHVRHHINITGTVTDVVRTGLAPMLKAAGDLDPGHRFLPINTLRDITQGAAAVVAEYQQLIGKYQTVHQLAEKHPEVTLYLKEIWDQLNFCVWQLQFIQTVAQEGLAKAQEFKKAQQFANDALGRLPELVQTTVSTEEAQWLRLVVNRLRPLFADSYRLSAHLATYVPQHINEDALSRNDRRLFTRLLTSQQAQLALLQQAVAETVAEAQQQVFKPSAAVQQELQQLSQRLTSQYEQPPTSLTEAAQPVELTDPTATIQQIMTILADVMLDQPNVTIDQPRMMNALVNMGAEISTHNKQLEITAILPGTLLGRLQNLVDKYQVSQQQAAIYKQHLTSHPLQVARYYTVLKKTEELAQDIRKLGRVFYKIVSEQDHPTRKHHQKSPGVFSNVRRFFAREAA